MKKTWTILAWSFEDDGTPREFVANKGQSLLGALVFAAKLQALYTPFVTVVQEF